MSTSKINKELLLIANTFRNGKSLTHFPSISFVGRIQYEPYNGYLTKIHRLYSFVSGEDTIYKMSKYNKDIDKCISVGFSIDWINNQINKQRNFRLLLFPKQSYQYKAIWCTWDNLFNLFKNEYKNDIYPRIKPFMNELKIKSFKEITKNVTFNFSQIEENGDSDPNYLSFKKFVQIPINQVTLIDVRLFLYCWLHLNELFDGNGYITDEYGNKGFKEYIIPNLKLKTIANLHIVPLKLTV